MQKNAEVVQYCADLFLCPRSQRTGDATLHMCLQTGGIQDLNYSDKKTLSNSLKACAELMTTSCSWGMTVQVMIITLPQGNSLSELSRQVLAMRTTKGEERRVLDFWHKATSHVGVAEAA